MGSALASKIDILKFEYTEKFLHSHACYNLIPIVQHYGFNIYQRYYTVGAKEGFRKYLAKNKLPEGFESELFAVRKGEHVTDLVEIEISEDDSDDNFCGSNNWSGTQIRCEERVQFLVRNYQMSEHNAKISILENGCQCR